MNENFQIKLIVVSIIHEPQTIEIIRKNTTDYRNRSCRSYKKTFYQIQCKTFSYLETFKHIKE